MSSEPPGPIVSFYGARSVGSTTWVTDNMTATGPKPTLTECFVYWCERQYSNNHVSPNSSWLKASKTQNMYVEPRTTFAMYYDSIRYLRPLVGNQTLAKNSTYAVYAQSWGALREMMISFFQSSLMASLGNYTGTTFPGIQSALLLYSSENLTQSLETMAESMSDQIRVCNEGSRVAGKEYTDTTFIRVRWPWIILLIASVVLTAVLLALTAVSSRRHHSFLWKSTLVPVFATRLETRSDRGLDMGNVNRMLDLSKEIKVGMASKDPPVLVEH